MVNNNSTPLRHQVKVTFDDGNTVITGINGTEDEVRDYYALGKIFNIAGPDLTGDGPSDNMVKVTDLEFLESAIKEDSGLSLSDVTAITIVRGEGTIEESERFPVSFKSIADAEAWLSSYTMPDIGYNKMDVKFDVLFDGETHTFNQFRYDHGMKDPSFSKQLDYYLKNNIKTSESFCFEASQVTTANGEKIIADARSMAMFKVTVNYKGIAEALKTAAQALGIVVLSDAAAASEILKASQKVKAALPLSADSVAFLLSSENNYGAEAEAINLTKKIIGKSSKHEKVTPLKGISIWRREPKNKASVWFNSFKEFAAVEDKLKKASHNMSFKPLAEGGLKVTLTIKDSVNLSESLRSPIQLKAESQTLNGFYVSIASGSHGELDLNDLSIMMTDIARDDNQHADYRIIRQGPSNLLVTFGNAWPEELKQKAFDMAKKRFNVVGIMRGEFRESYDTELSDMKRVYVRAPGSRHTTPDSPWYLDTPLDIDLCIGWFATVYNPAVGHSIYALTDYEKAEFGDDAFRQATEKGTSIVKFNLKTGMVWFSETGDDYNEGELKYQRPVAYRKLYIDNTPTAFAAFGIDGVTNGVRESSDIEGSRVSVAGRQGTIKPSNYSPAVKVADDSQVAVEFDDGSVEVIDMLDLEDPS